MATEYKDVTLEVQQIARELIARHHSHLVEANIKYLFRSGGAWTSKGKEVLGTAQKCSSKENFLTGFDFVITINEYAWNSLEDKQKIALIDHELMHCDKSPDYDEDGNPIWQTKDHDFVGFVQEVKRYGFWTKDLQKFDRVYRQITIFEVNKGA